MNSAFPSSDPDPVQVLLLGTYHFANPGHDLVKLTVHDHLAPVKQAEILEVVEALASFAPTKLVAEYPASHQARLSGAYREYCAGQRLLGVNETEQLGFRLAQRFGHETVYAIDQPADILLGEFMQEVQRKAPAVLASLEADLARDTERTSALLASTTVREALRAMNSPAAIREGHATYLNLVPFGAGGSFSGANVLSAWYGRNIRIYANLMQHLVPGDQALVVYGAGHLAILRELLVGTPGVEVVDTFKYL